MQTPTPNAAPAAPDALQSHTPDPAGIAPASAVETPADAAPPAARHAEQDAPPVLYLSHSGAPNNLPERSEPMPLTPELLADIRETLGDPEFPENQIDMQLLHDIAIDAKAKMVEGAEITQQALSRATDAEKALADKTQELSRVQLSRGAVATVDESLQAEVASIASDKIDAAVSLGRCPKPIAAKLKADLVDGDRPNVFMLSRHPELNNSRMVDYVLDLVASAGPANPLANKGDKTGVQVLARVVPDPDGDSPEKGAAAADLPYHRMAERHNSTIPATK